MSEFKSEYSQYNKKLWIGALSLIAFFILFFIILSFQGLPDFKQLENPEFELATQVIDIKDREIGRYYTQNRVPVTYDELNPNLIDALVATEDERFFSHSGVDIQALSRVVIGVLTFNTSKGGGSTITQQVAKNLFNTRGEELQEKLRQPRSTQTTNRSRDFQCFSDWACHRTIQISHC